MEGEAAELMIVCIAGQLNEIELENQTHKASAEDLKTRLTNLQSKAQDLESSLASKALEVVELTKKLATLEEHHQTDSSALIEAGSQRDALQEQSSHLQAEVDALKLQLKASQVQGSCAKAFTFCMPLPNLSKNSSLHITPAQNDVKKVSPLPI